jgi:hypothetical protein
MDPVETELNNSVVALVITDDDHCSASSHDPQDIAKIPRSSIYSGHRKKNLAEMGTRGRQDHTCAQKIQEEHPQSLSPKTVIV